MNVNYTFSRLNLMHLLTCLFYVAHGSCTERVDADEEYRCFGEEI